MLLNATQYILNYWLSWKGVKLEKESVITRNERAKENM